MLRIPHIFRAASLFILLFWNSAAIAQQPAITGKVTDSTGRPVQNASVMLQFNTGRDTEHGFSITDSSGFFSIGITPGIAAGQIKISALGFHPFAANLRLTPDSIYHFSLRSTVRLLEPARVIANNNVKVKGDTTTFNLAAFSNKNETSVEALVKKLPGFDVDQDGNMKYNGRPVEKVLLDGDDLFGNDFKMLTKNLSPDVLDKIQVIDNFSDKELLQGLGKSGKQVLNLKLKNQKKINNSANITLGGGLPGNWYDNRVNLLSVSPRLKAVTLGNMNNIGVNPFSFVETDRQQHLVRPGADQELEVTKQQQVVNVNELYYRGIDLKRNNFNKAFIGSTNFMLKGLKKAGIKGSAYFISDRNRQQQDNSITFLSGASPVLFTETNNLYKKQSYQGYTLQTNYRPAPKQEISYSGKYEFGRISHLSALGLVTGSLQSQLNTTDTRIEHRAGYINRLKDDRAITAELVYFQQKLPQTLTVSPVSYTQLLGLNPDAQAQLVQQSSNPVKQLLTSLKFIGRKHRTDYTVGIGYNYFGRDYVTAIASEGPSGTVQAKTGFQNNFQIINKRLYADAVLNRNSGKWSVTANTTANAENLAISSNSNGSIMNESYMYLQQRLNIGYKTTDWGKFSIQYIYKNKLPATTDLMPGMRMITYRSFEKGVDTFRRLNDHSIAFNYSLVDYYQKRLMLFAGMVYNTNPSHYLRNFTPLVSYDLNTRALRAVNNRGLLFYIRSEKYLEALSGNIIFDANNYSTKLTNLLAGLDVITGINATSAKLAFKSAWKNWLNIQVMSTAKLNRQSNNIGGKITRAENRFLESRANIYMIPKNSKWNIELSAEHYILPGGAKTSSLLFADFNIQYTAISGKLTFNLLGNNLLNNKTLGFENISLLQVSNQTFNLLPRYLMLRMYYKL